MCSRGSGEGDRQISPTCPLLASSFCGVGCWFLRFSDPPPCRSCATHVARGTRVVLNVDPRVPRLEFMDASRVRQVLRTVGSVRSHVR